MTANHVVLLPSSMVASLLASLIASSLLLAVT